MLEFVEEADVYHAEMTKIFAEVDEKRATADSLHEKFIESKKEADKSHLEVIKIRKDIKDLDKVIKALKAKQVKSKEEREREELVKKAKKVYEMFKNGEKLGTEDILLLQRAGLI